MVHLLMAVCRALVVLGSISPSWVVVPAPHRCWHLSACLLHHSELLLRTSLRTAGWLSAVSCQAAEALRFAAQHLAARWQSAGCQAWAGLMQQRAGLCT